MELHEHGTQACWEGSFASNYLTSFLLKKGKYLKFYRYDFTPSLKLGRMLKQKQPSVLNCYFSLMQLKFICFFFFKKPLKQSTFVAGAGGGGMYPLSWRGKKGRLPQRPGLRRVDFVTCLRPALGPYLGSSCTLGTRLDPQEM